MNEQDNQQTDLQMNPVSLTTKIFTDPQQAFENIKIYPNWIFPVLISIVVMILAAYATFEVQTDFQRDILIQSDKIPEAMKDQQLERFENLTSIDRYLWPALTATAMDIIIFLLTASGILVLGNFILGGKSSFLTVFSMVSWAGLIGVLELIVKSLIMISNQSIHAYTSLALMMDPSQFKEATFHLLNVVDIFTIWKLIVYIIGFGVIYQFPKVKAATGMIILFVLFTALKIGWVVISLSFI